MIDRIRRGVAGPSRCKYVNRIPPCILLRQRDSTSTLLDTAHLAQFDVAADKISSHGAFAHTVDDYAQGPHNALAANAVRYCKSIGLPTDLGVSSLVALVYGGWHESPQIITAAEAPRACQKYIAITLQSRIQEDVHFAVLSLVRRGYTNWSLATTLVPRGIAPIRFLAMEYAPQSPQ